MYVYTCTLDVTLGKLSNNITVIYLNVEKCVTVKLFYEFFNFSFTYFLGPLFKSNGFKLECLCVKAS